MGHELSAKNNSNKDLMRHTPYYKENKEEQYFQCSHGFHARSDMHVQLAPDYMICDFQTGTKFVSAYIDTRMKFRTRSRISFGLKTRMNSLQNDLYENDCHFGIMSTNTEK